jgi:hypothetical protein
MSDLDKRLKWIKEMTFVSSWDRERCLAIIRTPITEQEEKWKRELEPRIGKSAMWSGHACSKCGHLMREKE